MLVYFGFTFCPDICPNELVKIGSVLDKLGEALCRSVALVPVGSHMSACSLLWHCCGIVVAVAPCSGKAGLEERIQPLFISVDPTRDTVGQLKNYSQGTAAQKQGGGRL